MKELQNYITYAQQIYPKLKHVKGGATLSAPSSPVQIDGHYKKTSLQLYSQCFGISTR